MDLSSYSEAVLRSFLETDRRAGSTVSRYSLAGADFELRAAAPFVRDSVARALAHLEIPAEEAPAGARDGGFEGLQIHVWDNNGGGKPPPYLSWNDPREFYYRDFLSDGRIFVHCELWPHRLSILDLDRKRACFWISDSALLEDHMRAAPLRSIFHWWLRSRGMSIAHAAAVSCPSGGALLAGEGGAGKSTSSLACLSAGMKFAGDDYCAISSDGGPRAHSLFCTAKLLLRGKFDWLEPSLGNPGHKDGEKDVYYLHPRFAESIASGFEVKAALFPVVGNQPATTFEPMEQRAAAASLASSTMRQLKGASADDFYAVLKFMKKLPCFRMRLGGDPSAVPAAIQAHLAGL